MSDDNHGHLPATIEEPIANPGLPPHSWRPTDVDERLAKRAERQVAALFGLSAVCVVLFLVSYFTLKVGDNHTTFAG
ncbi:MAG: ubiquinol-cytochrome C reductase, partial [Nocardioides sp.]